MAYRIGLSRSLRGADSDSENSTDDLRYNPHENRKSEYLETPNFGSEVHSLEKLCLRSVMKNFSRFNTAYNTSKDPTLRRSLLFLQRVYSNYMISVTQGSLDDSYLKFVLNEHLTELNVQLLQKCSEKAILQRLSEMGRRIVRVNMNHSPTPSFLFEESELAKQSMKFLPNIQVLYVHNICNNEVLKCIASSCPKLEELYAEDSIVDSDGIINHLFKRKKGKYRAVIPLKVLSLTNTKVDANGIGCLLKNMPSLEILNHGLVATVLHTLHKDDVGKDTIKKYNLTTLNLRKYEHFAQVEMLDALVTCAAVCPRVKKLHVTINTDKHLDIIPSFTELEELTLESIDDTWNTDDPLSVDRYLRVHGGKLKKLSLSCCSLSVPVLLQSCPMLQDLSLTDIVFQMKEKNEANNLPSLMHLRNLTLEHFLFGDNPTEERSVENLLNSCPKLELLEIAYSEVVNTNIQTAISNFCSKSSLQALHFRGCDISAVMLECILLTCSSLRTLNINECDHILEEHINSLSHIIHSKGLKVNLIWIDHTSELNSTADDYFDGYDFSDESDYFYTEYEYNDEDPEDMYDSFSDMYDHYDEF